MEALLLGHLECNTLVILTVEALLDSQTIPRSHLVEPQQLILVVKFQDCSTNVRQDAITMCPYAEIVT